MGLGGDAPGGKVTALGVKFSCRYLSRLFNGGGYPPGKERRKIQY